MIIKFCIWASSGDVITFGTMPHLPEQEQLEYAINLARKYPACTLHCHPHDASAGLFILRPEDLFGGGSEEAITLEKAFEAWCRRAAREQKKGYW